MTTVIAISNEKGGVAKTTSTLSLGAALAELAITSCWLILTHKQISRLHLVLNL